MERVVVVGPPGSGKTTVARVLSDCLGAPHLELDGLFWRSGWTRASVEEFREAAEIATRGDRWVLDGNYFSATSDLTWPRADTVVWLDLPRRTTVTRVMWRTLKQGVQRTELWPGSRQNVRRAVAMIRFAWREHGKYRSRYEPLCSADAESRRWVRLTSPSAIEAWLSRVY